MDEREADLRETDALRPAADDAVVVSDLASDLRQIYDPTAAKSLPIYFGPLLGELFLANW